MRLGTVTARAALVADMLARVSPAHAAATRYEAETTPAVRTGNIFDRLVTGDDHESGLHLQGTSSGDQIVDLDSHGNRDPRENGESADGVAIKEGSGGGNAIRGWDLPDYTADGNGFKLGGGDPDPAAGLRRRHRRPPLIGLTTTASTPQPDKREVGRG
ncbi:hypothetical protein ACQEUU_23720 [Nonomuraea sp. CA-218870]|uniref:hypothetical protein n=1 Tax=Nonomuraea sp. CA-218870 TaxID=3239998 RepID=UPI003D8FD652